MTHPAWLRELKASVVVNPHVVLWGNAADQVLNDAEQVVELTQALWEIYQAEGYRAIVLVDRNDGMAVACGETEGIDLPVLKGGPGFSLDSLLAVIRRVANQDGMEPDGAPLVVLIGDASTLVADPRSLGDSEQRLFAGALKASREAVPHLGPTGNAVYSQVIWLTRGERDLPLWFTTGNPGVRVVARPLPNLEERKQAARGFASVLEAVGLDIRNRDGFVKDFADHSVGLSLTGMAKVVQLVRAQSLEPDEIDEAVRMFRYGFSDNPWRQPEVLRRISGGEDELRRRVKGQDRAIRLALDALVRSATGVSVSRGNASRPRGILVFAGASGVGKTELAKALAKLVFGSEDAMVRFDMSEYASEHTEARLVGAPPGYVGFDAGGQLTGAVRRQPFSLLLFDEVDKAHHRILDNFLQILEDGRLTDGAGETVSFGETILVFTTNLGIRDRDGSAIVDYAMAEELGSELVRQRVLEAIKEFFYSIQRPELLNRIGQNIVVFDFIDRETAGLIFQDMLEGVLNLVHEEHQVEVRLSDQARSELRDYCLADLDMGGRGIATRLEHGLVNPLSRKVFTRMAEDAPGPDVWDIAGIHSRDGVFELT